VVLLSSEVEHSLKAHGIPSALHVGVLGCDDAVPVLSRIAGAKSVHAFATVDDAVRAARSHRLLALLAGGDFIKSSTGKITPAATPSVALVMLEAVRDFAQTTYELRGVKVAGGIRASKEAIRYLVMVNEVAGEQWLDPSLFRFGASSLLNDLLLQRHKLRTGAYDGADYVTLD